MISSSRLVALLVGGALGLVDFDPGGNQAQAAGPLGRPVLPRSGHAKTGPVPSARLPFDPGPAVLTPPLARRVPAAGTVWLPGHWQGNRWVPGRLEIRKSRPTRWVPGYFTADGRWVRGRWE